MERGLQLENQTKQIAVEGVVEMGETGVQEAGRQQSDDVRAVRINQRMQRVEEQLRRERHARQRVQQRGEQRRIERKGPRLLGLAELRENGRVVGTLQNERHDGDFLLGEEHGLQQGERENGDGAFQMMEKQFGEGAIELMRGCLRRELEEMRQKRGGRGVGREPERRIRGLQRQCEQRREIGVGNARLPERGERGVAEKTRKEERLSGGGGEKAWIARGEPVGVVEDGEEHEKELVLDVGGAFGEESKRGEERFGVERRAGEGEDETEERLRGNQGLDLLAEKSVVLDGSEERSGGGVPGSLQGGDGGLDIDLIDREGRRRRRDGLGEGLGVGPERNDALERLQHFVAQLVAQKLGSRGSSGFV